jgi:hypothetical protein
MGYVLTAIWIACYEELLGLLNYRAFESVRYKGELMWLNDLNVYTTPYSTLYFCVIMHPFTTVK